MRFTIHEAIEATQEYLHEHGYESFEADHGIKAKSDGRHLILSYDQIAVNWNEFYGWVCRGLVLDVISYEVLAFPFCKFFNNVEEAWVDEIDWSSAEVYNKLDGTLFIRWYSPYRDEFVVTTRFQLPDEVESNKIMHSNITWGQLFRLATEHMELNSDEDLTTCYEVCSPFNQIVVQYPDPLAKLIMIRDNKTFDEQSIRMEKDAPERFDERFDLNKQTDIEAFACTLDGKESEGFVVVDADFNRMKIKTPSWKVFCSLSQSVHSSLRCQVEAVMDENNDVEELAKDFPHVGQTLLRIQQIIQDIITEHQQIYDIYKDLEEQKQFAIAIQDRKVPFSSVLFQLRAGKINSIAEGFYKIQSKYLASVVADKLQLTFENNEEE